MKPIYVLLITSAMMGVSVMSIQWELPPLFILMWVLSLMVIFYAARQSYSSDSIFLDEEFEKERASIGGTVEDDAIVPVGITGTIFTSLLAVIMGGLQKDDPSGRSLYNFIYAFAFLLWLPASFFMWALLFSLFDL